MARLPLQRRPIRFTEDTGGIFEDKWQKGWTGHFSNKIQETRSNDEGHESGRPKHALTEENVTAVDQLAGPLSQEGQTSTLFNMPDMQRDGSNTV